MHVGTATVKKTFKLLVNCRIYYVNTYYLFAGIKIPGYLFKRRN